MLLITLFWRQVLPRLLILLIALLLYMELWNQVLPRLLMLLIVLLTQEEAHGEVDILEGTLVVSRR